jgi:glycosyltransferase involved in cell wall biosynthesis
MRVALDAQLEVGTATGIGEYVRGLVPALRARAIDVAVLQSPRLDPWRFDRRVLWDQVLLPAAALRARPDLLHCTASSVPIVPLRLPLVVTVHDVAWHRVQQHTRLYARLYFRDAMARRFRAARAIVTDSVFSREELISCVGVDPGRVFVAYLGVDPQFARVVRRPNDSHPFILAVGTVERRKALGIAIEALAGIPDVRLVSVGPTTPYEQECRRRARALGISERVVFRGYVGREELLTLYATATLAIAPSLYEGFGYAAAQALCAGVPLLASDAASHPEIVGDPAALIPAGDVGAWREAIAAMLADPATARRRAAERRSEAVARFTWDSCARETIAAYEYALGAGSQ